MLSINRKPGNTCGETISLHPLQAAITPHFSLIIGTCRPLPHPSSVCANNSPCGKAPLRWLFLPFPSARGFFHPSTGSPLGCQQGSAHQQASCRSGGSCGGRWELQNPHSWKGISQSQVICLIPSANGGTCSAGSFATRFCYFLLCQRHASGNETALQLVTMGRPKQIFHSPVSHTPA